MAIFGRFTQRAQRAISEAQQAAIELKQAYVGTEHFLLGLLKEPGPLVGKLLPEHITYDTVMERIRTILGEGKHIPTGRVELTPRSKKILEGSVLESRKLGHGFVGT